MRHSSLKYFLKYILLSDDLQTILTTTPLDMIYIELFLWDIQTLKLCFPEKEFLVVPCLRCAIGGNIARSIVYIICQFITHSRSLKAFKLPDKKTETIKSSNNLILLFAVI